LLPASKDESSLDIGHLEAAVFEDPSVVIVEYRQKQLVGPAITGGRPVDIEVLGIGTGRAVLEYVLPPRVVPAFHG
jgi:hypothetical protein